MLAEEEGRQLTVESGAGALSVRLAAADLAAALDALLGNVFAHTPDGTDVAVSVRPRRGGGARVVVARRRSWPGARPGLGASAATAAHGSTGLGLDIARRTAEASGGSFHEDVVRHRDRRSSWTWVRCRINL